MSTNAKSTTNSSSIINTTSTTTTTTSTPVKVVEKKNNKVEETKETTTTTTTTKTTTIVTPVKEEAKKNMIVNNVWNDKHYIRVQMFRDVAFGRYGPNTKATEIHGDPERAYSQYNLQTIQRKMREVRLLVKAYQVKGLWLDEDPDFKERCQLDRAPTDEEKKGREEEYKRWEQPQARRMAVSKENCLSRRIAEELLGDFVALSIKSRVVKV